MIIGNCEGKCSHNKRVSPIKIRDTLYSQDIILSYGDIRSAGPFCALLDIKGNPVAFFKRFESGCIDCGMMNKHIRAVLLLNESEPFLVAKPLNGSIRHNNILLS
jgi:hypothetical protein